jgi:hypothetical protein
LIVATREHPQAIRLLALASVKMALWVKSVSLKNALQVVIATVMVRLQETSQIVNVNVPRDGLVTAARINFVPLLTAAAMEMPLE